MFSQSLLGRGQHDRHEIQGRLAVQGAVLEKIEEVLTITTKDEALRVLENFLINHGITMYPKKEATDEHESIASPETH